jgi:type IV pilus assembly protein PilV
MKPLFSKQQGFSLLEVLISTVVLAIGLLGIAALQGNAIRYNHSAQLRSIALAQASNMIDRMQANATGVNNGAYNNVTGTGSLPSCTTCSSAQIAQRDIYQWNTTNAQTLPLGQGRITRNGNQLTMVIRWDNDRSGATGLGCSGNTQIDLACLTLEIEI